MRKSNIIFAGTVKTNVGIYGLGLIKGQVNVTECFEMADYIQSESVTMLSLTDIMMYALHVPKPYAPVFCLHENVYIDFELESENRERSYHFKIFPHIATEIYEMIHFIEKFGYSVKKVEITPVNFICSKCYEMMDFITDENDITYEYYRHLGGGSNIIVANGHVVMKTFETLKDALELMTGNPLMIPYL